MTGTNPLAILSMMAPELLVVESIVLFLFLIFTMLSSWSMRDDPAILLPRTRFTEYFLLGALSLLWFAFARLMGFDQVLFALELALAILVSTIHPGISIGFFVFLLFLRPWEIAPPDDVVLAALPRSFAYLSMVTAFLYLSRAKKLSPKIGTPAVILLLFAGWTFLSTFIASDSAAAQSKFFEVFFKSVILFLVVTHAIRDQLSYRLMKAAFVFAALGLSSVSIYRSVFSTEAAGRLGTFGLLADPNDVSAIMILSFPFAWYFLRRGDRSLYLKIICATTIVATFVLLYFAKSRGALFSLLVMFAAMGVVTIKDKRKGAIIAVLAAMVFIPATTLFHRSADDTGSSTDSRIIYWKAGLSMATHSPLLGVGFGGYPQNFERYTSEFIEYGERTAHSTWVLAMAETGFPGLILIACFFLWALRASWLMREEYPELFFATLGYGVAASFLSHTWSIYLYLLVAVVFAGTRIATEPKGELT